MKVKPQEDKLPLKVLFGGVAWVTAGTITHPIDLVKTRMQIFGEVGGQGTRHYGGSLINTIKTVIHNEGFKSLYKGLSGTWAREGSYSTIRLGLYEPFKKLFGATDRAHTPLYIMLISGAMSGMWAAGLANPTDLLKIRMQAWEKHSHSIFWHAKYVYSHNGFLGFYRGVEATMTRAIVVNATQLPAYDFLKHKFINYGILNDDHICHLVWSVAAGIILTLVSGPFDLARTRLMNQPVTFLEYKL